MLRHQGKVAVITGAASGMGAAMCRRLVAEGARVVAADLRGADTLVEEIGTAALSVTADVSSAEDVQRVFDEAVRTFGSVDFICNNAGITLPPAPLEDIDIGDYDRVQAVNARAVFLGMKFGIKAIRATSGTGAIVNTASTSSLLALPGRTAYSGSKGAVAMLTKNAAVDYAALGIRVNAICPGPTRTGIFDAAIKNIPDVEARMAATVPLGRIAESDEMATVVSFLLSEEASFITGAVLTVDGGMSCVHVH